MIKKFTTPILIGLLCIALVCGGVLLWKYTKVQGQLQALSNKQEETAKANKKLIEQVAKIFEVPQGEEPTIATVTDKERLKGQPFFSKAENGDQVLLYTKSARAILFRPSSGKVIDVTSLTLNDQQSASQSAKPNLVRVSLLNGTTIPGLTSSIAKKLANNPGVSIVQKGNAKATTYTRNIVVNLTNVSKSVIDEISTQVGGTVEDLPAGEARPDADVLIILSSAK